MPKELIHKSEDATVKVGWDSEGKSDVQLGVGVRNLTVDGVAYEDVWVHMGDRFAVNRLIRTLRRARDATFGEDA